jgi:hypothetical protein
MLGVYVSYQVPYTYQFASPDLVALFLNKQRPLESDPNWIAYGADSPEEYAHWALRSCGVVCAKMAVEALSGESRGTVMDWVRAGLALDGYQAAIRHDRPVEKGWKHIVLAELVRQHGYRAELASELTLPELAKHVDTDWLIIASVTSELGENGPVTRDSGHLVVVYGYVAGEDGDVTHVIAHNPSGRTAALQQAVHIPVARFEQGFSGRGIIVGKRP